MIPVADLVFGGGILIIVMLVHATGLRLVGDHVSRRVDSILRRPSLWHADLLMGSIVFLLLALHVFEIFVWSCALVFSGLIPNWHDAGFFAGNTYTTIGYGDFVLSAEWEMVAPIMAISGLFTFGWSGSVLVDYVRRIHKIRDAVHAKKPKGHSATGNPTVNSAPGSQLRTCTRPHRAGQLLDQREADAGAHRFARQFAFGAIE